MKIVVAATDGQWKELSTGRSLSGWQRVDNCLHFGKHEDADVFFNLSDDQTLSGEISLLGKPVMVNSVIQTLAEKKAPVNVLRINGWPGFLKRSVWEVAGDVNENILSLFKELNIKISKVADEPGFIAARVIAMIINEGYFAVSDGVSSKEEIDTAMKLGTNYPYGPFEWAGLIGKKNVLALLEKLSATDKRYQPAELLIKEAKEKK